MPAWKASAELHRLGIPGVKYLDASSRAAGEGSRNFVVFDDKTIAILKKYGLAGLGLGLGAAAAGSIAAPNSAQATPFTLTPVDRDPFAE